MHSQRRLSNLAIVHALGNYECADLLAQLFPYANNVLGSVADANDVLQDVLTRNLTGHVGKSVSNNRARGGKKPCAFVDVWLPEPMAPKDSADQDFKLENSHSYPLLIYAVEYEHLCNRSRVRLNI